MSKFRVFTSIAATFCDLLAIGTFSYGAVAWAKDTTVPRSGTSNAAYHILSGFDNPKSAWDCRRPILVAVNATQVPSNDRDSVLVDLNATLTAISERSHFTFENIGATTAIPTQEWAVDAVKSEEGPDVVVFFGYANQTDLMHLDAAAVGGALMETKRFSRRQLLAGSIAAIPVASVVLGEVGASASSGPTNRFVAVVRGVEPDSLDVVDAEGTSYRVTRDAKTVISRGDKGPLHSFSRFEVGDKLVIEANPAESAMLAVVVTAPFVVVKGRVVEFYAPKSILNSSAGVFNTKQLTSPSAATIDEGAFVPGLDFEGLVWDDGQQRKLLRAVAAES